MNMEQSIKKCFQQYAEFSGRARRREYWYFVLFSTLCSFGSFFLGIAIGIPGLVGLCYLLMMIPTLAVTWRRLHDIGKSGCWYFIGLVPMVGPILLLVWLVQDSQPGSNQYGPNPKYGINGYSELEQRGGTYYIKVLSGIMKGQIYPIPPAGILIGRQVGCAICYPDSVSGISKQHCQLKYLQNQLVLIDLNSSYGTFVQNGKRIPPEYPEYVGAGTVFYLADHNNMFEIFCS